MTNAGSLSKIDRDDNLVLRAIRSAKHKVDHQVRSGVFGDTLERAISKLARRMKVSKNSIKRSIGKLMAEGLIKFAESRLFACHKNGRCGAYRRSLVKKGTAMRHQLALEAVRREMYQDPEWAVPEGDDPIPEQDPEVLALEQGEYGDWAAEFHSGIPTIPPAGGWEDCDAQSAQDACAESIRYRRSLSRFFIAEIHEASVLSRYEAEPCGLTADLANLEGADPSCDLMPDPANPEPLVAKDSGRELVDA